MNTSRNPLFTGLAATALAVCLATGVAAQPAAPAEQAPAQEQPPPPPPAEGQPPAEAQPAPSDAPPPASEAPGGTASVEDRLAKVEGEVEGMTEPFSAMQAAVAALNRIKLSGYIQGRYEWRDDANFGREFIPNATGGTTVNRGTNRFFVRRGRLKTTYVGTYSEYVLQIDATGDGVVLRDAEASFHLTNDNPWIPSATPWELKLTMGQFKVPFGFEVLQSSGDREFPERTLMIQRLYPGERDRGVRLQYSYDLFRLQAAVINGTFLNDPVGTADQSSWKDIVGRVGVDLDFLTIGVSGHQGRFLVQQGANPSMAMPLAVYRRFSRLRLGADAQAYIDIPGLGGLSLRGETIWARDKQLDFGGVAADANGCLDADRFGWYAALVQNVGEHLGLAVRVDQYDSSFGIPDSCGEGTTGRPTGLDTNNVTGVTIALLGYISGNLKATLAYDHYAEHDSKKRDNDAITVQMQAKF